MQTKLLSILIPVYNESECLNLLYQRLSIILDKLPCTSEIFFVNDGSTDDTLQQIKTLQLHDERIAYIDLSRNYGKETAMSAGINYIHGDALVIIDADLQDPPEIIPEMLNELEKGYDDVYACRTHRKGESWIKIKSAEAYYKWMKRISNIPIQENTGDFRIFSRKAIDALRCLKEKERNMKGLFSYIGFKKKPFYYERDSRIAGKTKWNYMKLLDLAINGFTSFSILPLRVVSYTGVIISIIAMLYLLKVVFKALIWGDPVAGYPSLMCVILFISGFILLAMGVIGEYIGVIYNETKKRPGYYICEYGKRISHNFQDKKNN